MSLPYLRTVSAIRPSGLRLLESNPLEFYVRFLGPRDLVPPRDQNFNAGVGTAFHAFCTDDDLRCLDLADRRDEAIDLARRAFLSYRALRCRPRKVAGVEVELEGTVPGTDVPIAGRADAVLPRRVIHDWKTTSSPNPKRGYKRMVGGEKRPRCEDDRRRHKDYGIPMEQINPEWADQLAMYGWCLGRGIRRARVSVDQVLIDYATGDVRVAQFRTHVGTAWQLNLRERLIRAWDLIQSESVVPEGLDLEAVRMCA